VMESCRNAAAINATAASAGMIVASAASASWFARLVGYDGHRSNSAAEARRARRSSRAGDLLQPAAADHGRRANDAPIPKNARRLSRRRLRCASRSRAAVVRKLAATQRCRATPAGADAPTGRHHGVPAAPNDLSFGARELLEPHAPEQVSVEPSVGTPRRRRAGAPMDRRRQVSRSASSSDRP
jgi:hypothetical protein